MRDRARSIVLYAVVLASVVGASPAWANAWTGKGDAQSFDDPMNWSDQEVPVDGDTVSIGATDVSPSVDVTGAPDGLSLASLTLDGSSLSGGSLTVTDSFTWTDGQSSFSTLGLPLTVVGTATISGKSRKNIATGDSLALMGQSTISGSGEVVSDTNGFPTITNQGNLLLEGGAVIAGSVCCSDPDQFVNAGTIEIDSGTQSIEDMDFQDPGFVTAFPGATLNVSAGTALLHQGAVFQGGGKVAFGGGDLVTISPDLRLAQGTTFLLGKVGASAGTATLSGSGALTGTGTFSWTGGTLSGSLNVGSTVNMVTSGTDQKLLLAPSSSVPASLTLVGPSTIGHTLSTHGAQVVNKGTMTLSSPGGAIQGEVCCISPDVLLNSGTIALSAGGTARLSQLDVQDHGAITLVPHATLDAFGGRLELTPGRTVSGGGTLALGGGDQVHLAGALSIGSGTTLLLGKTGTGSAGAAVSASGSLAGTGRFSWTGGTLSGSLNVASTVPTSIIGSDTKTLAGSGGTQASLKLNGPTRISATLGTHTARITNAGKLTLTNGAALQGSVCCASPDRVTNTGTISAAAGSGTASTSGLEFVNSGTVQAVSGTLSIGTLSYRQTAGSTVLSGGSLTAGQPLTIDGGSLSGSGAISGSVVTAGTTRPSATSGPLTVTGSYQQTSAGTLAATIGGPVAGSGFGQLAVTGAATLAGKVSVALANGFTPSPSQTFAVLTDGSQAGRFTALAGSPRSYAPIYQTTGTSLLFGVPWVTSLSPSTGPAAGGTTVTIHGGGFTAGDIVRFGSVRATSVTVSSATQIRAIAPPHVAGDPHVTVTSTVGASGTSNTDVFTYT